MEAIEPGLTAPNRRDAGAPLSSSSRPSEAGPLPPLLARPGRNCRARAIAERAAILIDGRDYFAALEDALRQARRSIIVIGWDFDGRIRLRPELGEAESPPLGTLLHRLVETRPDLAVHILVWSVSLLHAPGSSQELLFGAPWQDHPRIHVRLATDHPIYAAHHQKIVTIDDALAFVGGIDLTVDRWDTSDHLPGQPLRVSPDGTPYPPVHDVQVALSGEAARILATIARERWQGTTGEEIAAPAPRPLWPADCRADFRAVPVSIARTMPGVGGREPVTESAQQTRDALAAARQAIYIEAQYMTAFSIGRLLARRLSEETGPEVVIIMSHHARGFLERWVMQTNRDRLIRRLRQADRFDRLRVLYPCVPDSAGDGSVFVHSKLVIVDDTLLRNGSSNLNNRSIGLDSECDVLIEARDAAARQAIGGVRARLLAEHLGSAPETVSAAYREHGSLIAAIDALNRGPRCLRPFEALVEDGPSWPMPGTWLLDPKRPLGLLSYLLPQRSRHGTTGGRA